MSGEGFEFDYRQLEKEFTQTKEKLNFGDEKLSAKELIETLALIHKGLQNRQPLMRTIAGTMMSAVDQNFAAGGRPKWLGVKRGGMPLVNTGHLRNSIQAQSDNHSAQVGTNVPYAAIHQFHLK